MRPKFEAVGTFSSSLKSCFPCIPNVDINSITFPILYEIKYVINQREMSAWKLISIFLRMPTRTSKLEHQIASAAGSDAFVGCFGNFPVKSMLNVFDEAFYWNFHAIRSIGKLRENDASFRESCPRCRHFSLFIINLTSKSTRKPYETSSHSDKESSTCRK